MTTNHNRDGLLNGQSLFKSLGEKGCYVLSLISCGYRDGMYQPFPEYAIHFVLKALSSSFIDKDMYVLNPIGVLSLVDVPVSRVQILDGLAGTADAKILIGVFKHVHEHFVRIDHSARVIFDPLGESATVKFGRMMSVRAFY